MSRRSRRIAPPDRRVYRCPRCGTTAGETIAAFIVPPRCTCNGRLTAITMTPTNTEENP